MHSSDIRSKRFSTGPTGIARFFGERFDAHEVDTFLARCADSLAAVERRGRPTFEIDEIVTMQFTHRRWGPGYDPDEVDDYLDEIVVELRRAAGEQGTATSA